MNKTTALIVYDKGHICGYADAAGHPLTDEQREYLDDLWEAYHTVYTDGQAAHRADAGDDDAERAGGGGHVVRVVTRL